MAVTKVDLDRQAIAQNFQFGSSSLGGDANVVIENGDEDASNVVLDVKGSADIGGNVEVGGDITIAGDLNITGSLNSQNVTNLEVKDLTITLNEGGSAPTANTAGILVEGGGSAIGAIYYNSSSATKFTIGDGSSQQDIVGVTASQTLANKTLTTPTIADFSNATHNHSNAANGGQLTDAALSSAVGVAKGGTGKTSLTAYALLAGGATSTGDLQQVSGLGTAGQVLTSNGSGQLPSWQSIPSGGSSSFKEVAISGTQDSSNKTFTLSDTIDSADMIYLNGQLLTAGSTNDYEISGTTLTFTSNFPAPAATDVIRAFGNV